MARLRNFETKIGPRGFRAVLFRMVPKQHTSMPHESARFRAVLFRMVPKLQTTWTDYVASFRAVLFRMVPKRIFLLVQQR